MKPVEPEELSALLDGELPPARAQEIAAILRSDAALRADYEALERADASWRRDAAKARFTPTVSLGGARAAVAVLTLAAALIVLRFAPKLLDAPQLGWIAHALALSALLAAFVWTAERETRLSRPAAR